MATTIRRFKMPQTLLTPRQVSKKRLEEQKPRPLDSWHPGFCKGAAEETLELLELPPVTRPGEDPEMPPDVVRLSNETLGTLHAQFVGFYAYLDEQRALAEVEADEEEAYFGHVAAEIHLKKSGTVPDKKAKVLADKSYIEAEQRVLVAKARAKILKARVNGYDRCASALSREMTRRGLIPREH